MSRLRSDHKPRRRLRAAWAGLVLIAGSLSLSACSEAGGSSAGGYEPATLEPIKGTEVQRVKFSAKGAERVGLQTTTIRGNGQQKVIPYAAVIYGPEGNTFAYTVPERLTFVRKAVEVERVEDDRAILSAGPPVGTKVVTVGATEVYGTEFEVAH